MPETTLVIDAHIHLYPMFDLAQTIMHAQRNMKTADAHAVKIWLLTERADCAVFQRLLTEGRIGGKPLLRTADAEVLLLPDESLYIMAGTQIITREGLELCALATSSRIDDRKMTAAQGIAYLLDRGALVSINWAPGKWWGKRGVVVRELLAQPPQPGVFIGDTAMRPCFWPTPQLMREAVRNGWRIVAGSDPLPFKGEEKSFGRYTFQVTAAWNPQAPLQSLRSALMRPDAILSCRGSRRGAFEFVRRQSQIMREKGKR